MSTKTFPYRPFGGGDNLLIFVVISLTIHILFAMGLLSLKPFQAGSRPKEKEPIEVEVLQPQSPPRTEDKKPRYVVEVPPGPSLPTAPKDFTHYADRNWKVDKETYPEPSRKPAARSVPAPVPGMKGALKEPAKGIQAAAGDKGGGDSKGAEKAGLTKKENGQAGLNGEAADKTVTTKKNTETYEDPSKARKGSAENASGKENATPDAGSGAVKGAPGAARAVPSLPELFPTHERITELEKRYEAEAPVGEKGKTLQLNTSELRYQKYLINMKHRIEFYWEYPIVAARSGWQGVLNISFTIKKDGTVANITVVKSSNYPVLDDAAVTALRLANPFPPFPDNFGVEEININGQFEYKLYGAPTESGG